MKASKVLYAFSSILIMLVVILVVITNAVPATSYAHKSNVELTSDNDTIFVEKTKKAFKQESTADKMIALGKSLIGTRYTYAGRTTETGFDCSGFTHYIFGKFGIELSPASKEQIFAGEQVNLNEVRKGDLLVFTGTNLNIRQPGHVGIVITKKGEKPVKFVHSSSVGGVKISQVDDTRYAERLLQVRRLLD